MENTLLLQFSADFSLLSYTDRVFRLGDASNCRMHDRQENFYSKIYSHARWLASRFVFSRKSDCLLARYINLTISRSSSRLRSLFRVGVRRRCTAWEYYFGSVRIYERRDLISQRMIIAIGRINNTSNDGGCHTSPTRIVFCVFT